MGRDTWVHWGFLSSLRLDGQGELEGPGNHLAALAPAWAKSLAPVLQFCNHLHTEGWDKGRREPQVFIHSVPPRLNAFTTQALASPAFTPGRFCAHDFLTRLCFALLSHLPLLDAFDDAVLPAPCSSTQERHLLVIFLTT